MLNDWATNLQTSLTSIVTMVTEYTSQQEEKMEWLQKNLTEQHDIDEVYTSFTKKVFTDVIMNVKKFEHPLKNKSYNIWKI